MLHCISLSLALVLVSFGCNASLHQSNSSLELGFRSANQPDSQIQRQLAKDTCPARCELGYSCSSATGWSCQPCATGYYSVEGFYCIECYCALEASAKEICDKISGKCICNNFFNMCTKIVIFGSTSNIVWLALAVAVLFLAIATHLHFRSKKKSTKKRLDEKSAMAQIHEIMAALDNNSRKSANKSKRSNVRGSQNGKSSRLMAELRRLTDQGYGIENQPSSKVGRGLRTPEGLLQEGGSDLDEVTTAIIKAAKSKIRSNKSYKGRQASSVKGDYYVDRVTGKLTKEIIMDAEAEGELLSVIFPRPDAQPNCKYDENNNTDILVPMSEFRFKDADVDSLHFDVTIPDSDNHPEPPYKSGKRHKKKLPK